MNPAIDRDGSGPLLDYITAARWFAGKGRRAELVTVTALPWLTEGSQFPAVRFEVAEIGYPVEADGDGPGAGTHEHQLYQLAVAYRPTPHPDLDHAEIHRFTDPDIGPVVAYDAMADPEACRLLITMLLNEKQAVENQTTVSFRLSSAGGLTADLDPQIFTGQQSNTSVMYGDVAMLKLFRRLELGRNLDIEVHDALSRAGVADVAQLFGWIEAKWPQRLPGRDGTELVSSDLAMVVAKLAQAEDGWALALESLGGDPQQPDSFVEDAHQLGQALAEIHAALRENFPTASVAGAQVATVMKQRLAGAVGIAAALQPHQASLERAFDQLSHAELDTQRLHGDFHLGQTLRTPQGWKIIDFEGEPVKTLVERAEPDNVWRDIAGMLRSFDYAAASVPGPRSQEWASACREAFLDGYVGGRLEPGDAAVLRAYEADKAVYEVVYEVRNRPDWVGIPLGAVATLSNTSVQHAVLDPATITKEQPWATTPQAD